MRRPVFFIFTSFLKLLYSFFHIKNLITMKSVLIILAVFTCITATFAQNNLLNKNSASTTITKTDPQKGKFPGGRGSNEIIVYTPAYGEKTGTNMWGIEAIIENGVVISVGDNNSTIPSSGFVVSGNGDAARWITKNLTPGIEVSISDNQLVATNTPRSKTFYAEKIFNKAKENISDQKSNKHFKRYENSYLQISSKFKASGSEEDADASLKAAYEFLYRTYPSRTKEWRAVWWNPTCKDAVEMEATFKDMAETGINMVCPQTIFSGTAIYPNAHPNLEQNPRFKGWDPLKEMIRLGKKYHIEVVPWVWVYYIGRKGVSPLIDSKKEWLSVSRTGKNYSDMEKGYHFFCQSEEKVDQFWIEVYENLFKNYDINALQLDYIRYPVSTPWDHDFCYCDRCTAKFKKQTGKDPKTINPNDHPDLWKQWEAFRIANVDRIVSKIRNRFPKITLSADVFPDVEQSLINKKQNWGEWLHNDYINEVYIMSYTADVSQVKAHSDYLAGKIGKHQIAHVGLGPYLGLKPEILLEEIEVVQQYDNLNITLFSWNSLSPQHKEALKKGPFRSKAKGIK
ncbi:hypothetical protein EYV94_26210 [Puteibacter caeruleilacunae]|nr:hypothetical protein EYV94_26210 [Puteibacter caeruleilacunae]